MNNKQRELVRYWVLLTIVILIGLYISFSDIENIQIALLLLTVPVAISSMFQDFSYYIGYGKEGEGIGAFIEKHQKVKYWLIFFCLAILPFIIYKMTISDSNSEQEYLYFLSFFLLIGPVTITSEIERFRSLGD